MLEIGTPWAWNCGVPFASIPEDLLPILKAGNWFQAIGAVTEFSSQTRSIFMCLQLEQETLGGTSGSDGILSFGNLFEYEYYGIVFQDTNRNFS